MPAQRKRLPQAGRLLLVTLLGIVGTACQDSTPVEPVEAVSLTHSAVVEGEAVPSAYTNVMSLCIIPHPDDPFIETPPFPVVWDGDWLCMPAAGTLVTRRVAITAAHFQPFFDAFPPQAVSMQLGPSYDSGAEKATGTYHAHPEWDPNDPLANDVAVIVFDEPVRGRRLARLPRRIGEVDRLRPGRTRLRLVDFGNTVPTWPPVWGARTTGITTLTTIEPGYITVAPGPRGPSVGCNGHSGSPAMRLGRGMRIMAVGGVGSGDCLKGEWYSRLDTWSVVDFLADYIPEGRLPEGWHP